MRLHEFVVHMAIWNQPMTGSGFQEIVCTRDQLLPQEEDGAVGIREGLLDMGWWAGSEPVKFTKNYSLVTCEKCKDKYFCFITDPEFDKI